MRLSVADALYELDDESIMRVKAHLESSCRSEPEFSGDYVDCLPNLQNGHLV